MLDNDRLKFYARKINRLAKGWNAQQEREDMQDYPEVYEYDIERVVKVLRKLIIEARKADAEEIIRRALR